MDYKEDKELTKETKIILLKILKRGFITKEEKNGSIPKVVGGIKK